jgi:hypothetical protein
MQGIVVRASTAAENTSVVIVSKLQQLAQSVKDKVTYLNSVTRFKVTTTTIAVKAIMSGVQNQ